MINIKIPLYTFGTAINHINLRELDQSPSKSTQILLQNSTFNIYICHFSQLSKDLLINKNVILLIQFEELIEFDEQLQNLFDLIHFAQVKKVLCLIVLKESIKKCQWKIDIVKKYIEISTQKFIVPNYSQPNYNIQSIQSEQNILNQLYFFQTTPIDPDFNKNNDVLMQILSRNKNELEVALIKGIIISSDFCFFENQNAENKKIQIIEIEGNLNYRYSNQDNQIFRIKISDDTELKNQSFISNNPFQIKQFTEIIVFKAKFNSIKSEENFYMNYRKTSNMSVLIGGEQYDIKNLEFFNSTSYNKFKLTLSSSKFVCVQQFSSEKGLSINNQLIIIDKVSEEIIAFGEVEEDNFQINLTQNIHQQQIIQEIEEFYLPLNDEDILQNIARGELQQKGNHIIKCRICMENCSNTLLIPCGHLRYCFDCSADIQDCLFCDSKILSKKKINVKLIQQNQNELLKDLMWKYQDLLRFSLQQNINVEQNLKINRIKNQINFNQYYCQKCNKSKGTRFVNCEKNHLINYCEECSKQIKECELNGCNQNQLHKGEIQFKFDE
ncbi:unnamed protein product [Paramecium sonneborni]|uniref:RING-type domain-containing protein n=1 Tax=Paramecium sonneborni TaxID=65129 RepID=A0A8S1RGA2_9CILI|nr:unnamed protein product [Paramecium sonneborni]